MRVFQASPENTQEIKALLLTSDQLLTRVQAALRVNPKRAEVKAWGALILAAQQGEESAIAWLEQQPKTTPATVAYIKSLLKPLGDEPSKTVFSSTGALLYKDSNTSP